MRQHKLLTLTVDTKEDTIKEYMGQLAAIFPAYWDRYFGTLYGPFALDVESFVIAWLHGRLIFVAAYEDQTLVGFALCNLQSPLTYQSRIITIEEWFGLTPEIENDLITFTVDSMKEKGALEISKRTRPLSNGNYTYEMLFNQRIGLFTKL